MYYYLLVTIAVVFYIFLARKKPAAALVTSPFVSAGIFMLGLAEENQILLYGSLAILFIALLTILFTKFDSGIETWPRTFAKYFLTVTLCILICICAVIISKPLSVYLIIFFFIFLGSLITYHLTSRNATASFVFSTIGGSIRQNLPLPMALETAGTGYRDGRVKILESIKRWLVEGFSLSESIRRGYPACPGHALAMIATAERIDQVPQAIRMIEADLAQRLQEKNRLKPIHPIYPVIVLTFLFFIVWGILLFVMPTYAATVSEMTENGRLPLVTRIVMNVSRFIIRDFGPVLIVIIAIIFLIIVPFSIYIKFRPRRPEDPYLFSLMADRIKWHLPVIHWFERNYSMVQAVEMLRLSLNAGCTINDAIANTIDLDVNCCFRDILKDWLENVEAGANVSQAAQKSRLGPAIAWAFDEKVNQGNTLAILETLESFYRTNYNYRINLARFIFWPCLVLLIGLTVGLIAIAFFYPGVEMINNLTNTISP